MDYFKKSFLNLINMSASLNDLGYSKLASQIDYVSVKFAAFWDAENAHADEVASRTNDNTLSEQVNEENLSVQLGESLDEGRIETSQDLVYECAQDLKTAISTLQDTDRTEEFMAVVDAIHERLIDFFDTAAEADMVLQKIVDAVLDSSKISGEERELILALVFDSNPSEYLGE